MEKLSLKQRLAGGETVIGSWNTIPSPSLIEIIGYSGLDFIVIDAEHGPVSTETAENLIRASEVTGMTPIVRVADKNSYMILSALDMCAIGVQIPHISTKKEALSVVEYAKYYPSGMRGLSTFTRASRYSLDSAVHVKSSNDKTMVILNIEGREGIKNLKEIVKVPDIDVIFIGPYDLSQSLGKPGNIEDKELINCIKRSVRVAESKGIACGSFAKDMKYMDILLDCGVRYITYMVDSAIILNSYKEIRELCQKKIEYAKSG